MGPYSQAIKAGGFLFVSGQVPLTADGRVVVGAGTKGGQAKGQEADVKAQTRQALRNTQAVLAAGGCRVQDVVKVTVFVTDMGRFAEVNEVYKEFFEPRPQGQDVQGQVRPPPARSLVQVAALPLGVQVEVEAIAVCPAQTTDIRQQPKTSDAVTSRL